MISQKIPGRVDGGVRNAQVCDTSIKEWMLAKKEAVEDLLKTKNRSQSNDPAALGRSQKSSEQWQQRQDRGCAAGLLDSTLSWPE